MGNDFNPGIDLCQRLNMFRLPYSWIWLPIGSMYGIYTYIWFIFMVNVGEYTIHGLYGLRKCC